MTPGPLRIRPECPGDAAAIAAVVTAAFRDHPFSRGQEAPLIAALRAADALTVGLVAEMEGQIVGHVAISPATIGAEGGWYALGPLAVQPDRQRRGIGQALVRKGLEALHPLAARGCVLVGDARYYGRFGFAARPGLRMEGIAGAYVLALPFGGPVPAGPVQHHAAFHAFV